MWFVRRASPFEAASASTENLGPFSKAHLLQEARENRLGYLDSVYSVEENRWQLVGEIDFLRDELAFRAGTGTVFGEWTVLRNPGPVQEMAGPFTREEVLKRISVGQISYSDLAWKAGDAKWMRIGDSPLFDQRMNDPVVKAAKPAIPIRESGAINEPISLENMMRRKNLAAAIEAMPEEAVGEDLVSNPVWMRLC